MSQFYRLEFMAAILEFLWCQKITLIDRKIVKI